MHLTNALLAIVWGSIVGVILAYIIGVAIVPDTAPSRAVSASRTEQRCIDGWLYSRSGEGEPFRALGLECRTGIH